MGRSGNTSSRLPGSRSGSKEPTKEPKQHGDVWYYADNNEQVGPFTLQELKDEIPTIPNANRLYVWCEGMEEWTRAGEVRELFPRPPTPPPSPTLTAGPKTIVRKEIRKRGFFGKLVKFLFIIFNLLMIAWLVSYWAQVGELVNHAQSEAGKTGAAIGATIGTGFVLFFWVAGDIILGLLTILTRGSKVIVEETM